MNLIKKMIVFFVSSPLHVPIRRYFKDGIPADGQLYGKTLKK